MVAACAWLVDFIRPDYFIVQYDISNIEKVLKKDHPEENDKLLVYPKMIVSSINEDEKIRSLIDGHLIPRAMIKTEKSLIAM